jgi:L-asparaginase type I
MASSLSRSLRRRSPSPANANNATAASGAPDVANVLCLYVGGTVGMVPTERGLEPKAGFLAESLAKRRAFHDKSQPLFTTPVTRLGGRIHYEIREYTPLLDSSNMNSTHWARIATDIRDAYEQFDAFIVLHGTDTMCYTAAALSFMLMNLGKTVILTGSAIPLAYEPNDATDNIGGALLIAGHFDIPEVTVFFRDQLFRGNRCTKINAAGLDAFAAGNCAPLAQVGVFVNVRWDIVRTPAETKSARGIRVLTGMEADVGVLVLFPGIQARLIRQFLAPPLLGCVMQSFGSGNVPDDADVLAALEEACGRGVIIVNLTQCFTGTVVHGQYSVSATLDRIGVLPGFDMTREAALTKLAFLLARYNGDAVRVRESMLRSLRGELTEPNDNRRSWRKEGRHSSRRSTAAVPTESDSNNDSDGQSGRTNGDTKWTSDLVADDADAADAPSAAPISAPAPAAAETASPLLLLRERSSGLHATAHPSAASDQADNDGTTVFRLPTVPDCVEIEVRATDEHFQKLLVDPTQPIRESKARESKC